MCGSRTPAGDGGGTRRGVLSTAGRVGELEGSGDRVRGAPSSCNLIGPHRVHAALRNLSEARREENGVHCFWGLAAVAPLGAAAAGDRGPDEARHC